MSGTLMTRQRAYDCIREFLVWDLCGGLGLGDFLLHEEACGNGASGNM